ncbi:MAG: ferrochelatase [Myxococcota bacterium]
MNAFIDNTRLSEDGPKKTALVILNFGGPTKKEEVQPFLFELFDDPDVIQLPLKSAALRRKLAQTISSRRAPKVIPQYESIGFSPIVPTTIQQIEALAAALGPGAPKIYTGMRYTAPTIPAMVQDLARDRPDRVVALALYPHYSDSTTGSSFNAFARALKDAGLGRLPVRYVPAFYDHPRYLSALRSLIVEGIQKLSDPSRAHLIFSAHGLPSSYYRGGDPYPNQVQETVRLVMRELAWNSSYALAFQSKVGPVRWLEPSTEQEIHRVAAQGTKEILVVPIAFVSDHIETLYEIDVTFAEFAQHHGAKLHRTRALDLHPEFIACLREVIEGAIADDTYRGLGAHRCVRCLLPRPHEHRMRSRCMDCGHATPEYLLRLPPVRE